MDLACTLGASAPLLLALIFAVADRFGLVRGEY
jgi:hypothetical protein